MKIPAPFVAGKTPDNYFEAMVQSCEDAIVGKSINGIVTSWNLGAEKLFGYSEKEMIGQPLLRLFPIDRLDEEFYIYERILAGERVPSFDTIRIRKNGTPVNVSVTISPVHDADGNIVGACKIARDISAQHRSGPVAEEFRALVAGSGDAIIARTLDGAIACWNGAAQAMFGYRADEMIGQPVLRLFPQDRVDEAELILNKICLGETMEHFETVRLRKDGTEVHISATLSPIRDHQGAVAGVSMIARDITPLRLQKEKLEHSAQFDCLTGLPNRLLLADRLRQAVALSKRNDHQAAVVSLDLDGFGQINEEHGTEAGDAVLLALSQRISGSLRAVDTLARVGGDQFVAVLADVDGCDKLKRVLNRILKSCSDPVHVGDKRLVLSASMGITVFPHDNADEEQLLRHADQAMYEAKQSGKNRYQIFDACREAADKSRHTFVRRVAEALQNDELVLHYQPKVNMKTGLVVGVEALIRWQHPERGQLSPAQFLPLIEGHRVNEEIGIWVIGCALKQMNVWRQAGIRMPVSVNLAPHQLQNEDFPAILAGLLARYPDIVPNDLELEILETSALQDIDAASRVMQACRRLGVQFSIDDFGTGYSSLTYLKRLPACTLKIDQSFVRDMLNDHEDLAIVRGVIGLAKAFQRKVIAEGVETIEHGKILLEMGCELAQGYGISRPMKGEYVEDWLAAWNGGAAWR